MIRTYLRDIVNDHKNQGKWKVNSGNEMTEKRGPVIIILRNHQQLK